MLMAVAGAVLGAIAAYNAASNELTGSATYREPSGARGSRSRIVMRNEAPTEFRHATNNLWALSICCFAFGTIGFLMYRRIDDIL